MPTLAQERISSSIKALAFLIGMGRLSVERASTLEFRLVSPEGRTAAEGDFMEWQSWLRKLIEPPP